jgi:hypothetical protein
VQPEKTRYFDTVKNALGYRQKTDLVEVFYNDSIAPRAFRQPFLLNEHYLYITLTLQNDSWKTVKVLRISLNPSSKLINQANLASNLWRKEFRINFIKKVACSYCTH